jgi:hypothetical protein
MTDFDTFCATIAEWANREDWSSDLVTQFVRSAEQKLNSELRIDLMINTYDAIIGSCCAPMPSMWLEMDLLLMQTPGSASGWRPLRYRPRDEFFRLPGHFFSGPAPTSPNSTYGQYTIEGRQIYFGGLPDQVDGRLMRMSYYAEVPVFSETQDSWVYDKYPSLYRSAALMDADLHAVGEEQKAGALKQLVEDMIQKLNAAHQRAKASGSRLARARVRSFG